MMLMQGFEWVFGLGHGTILKSTFTRAEIQVYDASISVLSSCKVWERLVGDKNTKSEKCRLIDSCYLRVLHHLPRPTCRPKHAAALVPTPHLQSILVKKPYGHSNHRHALGIALILGSCSVPDERRFRQWILTGYTLRVQEAMYLYPKQQLSSREIDFWYFCLHRTQCRASDHRTGLSILKALYPIRASTNKLTMSLPSLLLFISMFCVCLQNTPPAFRGHRTT